MATLFICMLRKTAAVFLLLGIISTLFILLGTLLEDWLIATFTVPMLTYGGQVLAVPGEMAIGTFHQCTSVGELEACASTDQPGLHNASQPWCPEQPRGVSIGDVYNQLYVSGILGVIAACLAFCSMIIGVTYVTLPLNLFKRKILLIMGVVCGVLCIVGASTTTGIVVHALHYQCTSNICQDLEMYIASGVHPFSCRAGAAPVLLMIGAFLGLVSGIMPLFLHSASSVQEDQIPAAYDVVQGVPMEERARPPYATAEAVLGYTAAAPPSASPRERQVGVSEGNEPSVQASEPTVAAGVGTVTS